MATRTNASELLPLPSPYLEDDIDDAVAFDVADFDDLRLLSAFDGEALSLRLQVAEL
ncbi:hypothetical protein LZ198_42290 [Myxococcus sp. K15C18031901]|uniref:hypothetical protein n=1 Tax=Myxococcus dinghuensis TaxID=2906761 RepID=UPI0020A780CC|nr:hypothetical protein [Myxococcus dinghuensis]MCP3105506.1 hypothetical protein [Myxococcus dinghuensis]